MKNTVVIPILNNEYKVVVCWGKSKYINKVLKEHGHKDIDGTEELDKKETRGLCFTTDGCWPVICLPVFPNKPDQIGTLAHESIHAMEQIYERIGETTKGEIFAHSIGAIVRTTLKRGKK